MEFVNLHNYSNYSILQALPKPQEIITRAKELNQKAVALTDKGTLAGTWDAFKAAKNNGIKLILGVDFYFFPDRKNQSGKIQHVVLLAMNQKGYRNLLALNKEGYENPLHAGRKVLSIIDWELLEKYSEGVICLTGCGNSLVNQLINKQELVLAEEALLKLVSIFGKDRLGVELQAHNLNRMGTFYEEAVNQIYTNFQLNRLALKHELKVVATSNSFYLKKEERDVHDVLLAIGSMQPVYSNARPKYPNSDFYLKTGEEIKNFFSRNFGETRATELVDNSIYFSNLCEEPDWIDPKYSNPSGKELPHFPVEEAEDYQDFKAWWEQQEDKIKKLALDEAYLRYRCFKLFPTKKIENKEKWIERLEKELEVLNYCGVASYMLIVADYIDWARKNGVSVGPGRGSVAGCAVAYVLGIHNVDTIKYNLVFERFHNKLKKSYSDIDEDFAKRGREKVIDYVTEKYGKDKVAGISNVVLITPKIYVRDISRSLDLGKDRKLSVEIGNKLADTFLAKCKTMDEVINTSPLFNENIKKYTDVLKYKGICGTPRGASTHAAGIVIGARPLQEIVPIRKDKENNVVIEYNKDVAEENGLVKMDFLGLSTLDIIDEIKDLIYKTKNIKVEIDHEAYDEKTYELITSGDTYGVFQFGTSAGTIDLCKKIKPKNIEDLAVITTLARPASAEIREDFIKDRENGKMAKVIHPSLNNALKDTFGYPLYDESLLILANDVAGWDLAEADKLRKLTKEKGKNPKKVEQWKQEFIEGAVNNKVPANIAEKIWDTVIANYAKYSFNKSHAVAYSMVSYETAYLKAHYPVEFLLVNLMAEVNSNTPNADENIAKAKKELRNRGVKILSPDINSSKMYYTLVDDKTILTGLNALKFVSDDAINEILEKRPFKSFHDFMVRCDSSKMRSNAIQALAASGCLDSFKLSRKEMFLYCSEYRKKLQVWRKKHDPEKEEFIFEFPKTEEWSKSEIYALENFYVGESFTVHKKDAYGDFFQDKKHASLSYVKKRQNKESIASIKAEIKSIFELQVKKEGSKYLGKNMAKIMLEDAHGTVCGMTVFPDVWESIMKSKNKIDVGYGINFSGTVNIYDGEMGIILDRMISFIPPPKLPADIKKTKKEDMEEQEIRQPKNDLIDEFEEDIFS